MLGWVLRKGLEGVTSEDRAADNDDTTYIEQPDTPAPVFAARAFKSAIFGTPGQSNDDNTGTITMDFQEGAVVSSGRTPTKPQGILLTPGTGTCRRKRVSFDHHAVDNENIVKGKDRARESRNKFSAPFGSSSTTSTRRTRLTETMAKLRRNKSAAGTTSAPEETRQPNSKTEHSDEDWEEEDEDNCVHDITLDLNEPHSRSGRYWKSEFDQYHQDARSEMEKLLKYKQLAKSYAKMKDAEAIDLKDKLKDAHESIAGMEKQIAEMAAQITSKRIDGGGENPQLMKDLARQTALAVQYRTQVEDLEDILDDNDNQDEHDSKHRRRRPATSPRTQKTLLETQRELRRARIQIKENGHLKEQIKQLKQDLRDAESRASRKSAENSNTNEYQLRAGEQSDMKLQESLALHRRMDEDFKKMREEYDAYKAETFAREQETKQVLQKATDKISELKKEIRTLKSMSIHATGSGSASSDKPVDPTQNFHRLAKHGARKLSGERGTSGDETETIDLMQSLSKTLNRPTSQSSKPKGGEAPKPVALPATTTGVLGKKKQSETLAPATTTNEVPKSNTGIFEDRPDLEKPRWKPFIPRSPRNREYLGADLNKLIKQSSTVPTGTTPVAPRHTFRERDLPHIDLLQDQFARLGVPEFDTSTMLATTKSGLPPERRAAAIARIERRKAEKKRKLEAVLNKENVRP